MGAVVGGTAIAMAVGVAVGETVGGSVQPKHVKRQLSRNLEVKEDSHKPEFNPKKHCSGENTST